MSQIKTHGRNKKHSFYQRLPWLPIAVVGSIALILVGGFIIGRVRQGSTPTGQSHFTSKPEIHGAPHVTVSQDSFDYGDVTLGTTIETTFEVRNEGDKPLVILDNPQVEVVEGCCPPRTMVNSMTVEPGNQVTVSLQFMMHEGMGGQHEFRVHVRTNDPTEPDKQVTIRSNWIS